MKKKEYKAIIRSLLAQIALQKDEIKQLERSERLLGDALDRERYSRKQGGRALRSVIAWSAPTEEGCGCEVCQEDEGEDE